jgi:hypothetical protein
MTRNFEYTAEDEEILSNPDNKGCEICGRLLVVSKETMEEGYICGVCIGEENERV